MSALLCVGRFDGVDKPIRHILIQQLEVFLPHVSDHLVLAVRFEDFEMLMQLDIPSRRRSSARG